MRSKRAGWKKGLVAGGGEDLSGALGVGGGVGDAGAREGAGVPLFVAELEVDDGEDLSPGGGLAEGGTLRAVGGVGRAGEVLDEAGGFGGRGAGGHGVPGLRADGLAEGEELVQTEGDVFAELLLRAGSGALASERRGEHVVEGAAEVGAVVHVAEDAGVEVAKGLDDLVAEGGGVVGRVLGGGEGDVVEQGAGLVEGEGEADGADRGAGLVGGEVEGVVVPAGVEGEGSGEEGF